MIKNKKIIWILLSGIVILASVLRLWQLGNIPPSPDWDEVALGYNAYSILQTGRDEYGKFFPVVLRSFDDYKPALYAYLAIPSILFFDLTVFAVRLPSAVLGVLSVIAVVFLIYEIFENYKYRDYFALLSGFFLAISPWNIQFSRVGFESNIGLALNIFMVLFFIKALKKPWMLSLSALFGALSMYAYQSEKVFTPLLVVALIIIYRKKLFSISSKYLLFAGLVGLIFIFPMLFYIFTNKEALLRVTGTSIFNYKTELLKPNVAKIGRDIANNDLLGLLFDNRRVVYFKTIISGYISHFDLNWLFVKGDIARHHAPGMGLLYLFELPLILIGIYKLIFDNFRKSAKYLIFAWFLIAAIPASVTFDVPHAVRTLNFLPIFQIFSALGFIAFVVYFQKYLRYRFFIFFAFGIVMVFNFSYYINQYFVQLNYYDSSEWQYGYQQVVAEVSGNLDKYSKIVVADARPMDKSYMFFLFYLKYDPREYQKVGIKSSGNFAEHHAFGKFVFRPLNWSKDMFDQNVLYVGTPQEIPAGAPIIKRINYVDGSEAIRLAGT